VGRDDTDTLTLLSRDYADGLHRVQLELSAGLRLGLFVRQASDWLRDHDVTAASFRAERRASTVVLEWRFALEQDAETFMRALSAGGLGKSRSG
jgi:hypothetical protein